MSDELKRYYLSTLKEKIRWVNEVTELVKKGNGLEKGKIVFHKISGSAGSYGFNRLSVLAKDAELFIDNLKNSSIINKKELLNKISSVLEELKRIEKNG